MMKLLLSVLLSVCTMWCMAQDHPKPDTLEIGGITIIRDNDQGAYTNTKKKGFLKKLSSKPILRK
ncbi:hypothetical protein [Niabella ginsengisoli]|uniref:Uncharacterized protein n=1 Tax=Niabella ginsengisoli TaxID=522298 RepID=A0ABS9SQC0_9BACT|nr:hypothetical protein [Niabella ginsengisoli]MCH5600598.1 hypothetical protein [Niabella ginsengisoli]